VGGRQLNGWVQPEKTYDIEAFCIYDDDPAVWDDVALIRARVDAFFEGRQSYPYIGDDELKPIYNDLLKPLRGDDLIRRLVALMQLRLLVSIEYDQIGCSPYERTITDAYRTIGELLKALIKRGLDRKMDGTSTLVYAGLDQGDLAGTTTGTIFQINRRVLELAVPLKEKGELSNQCMLKIRALETQKVELAKQISDPSQKDCYPFRELFDQLMDREADYPIEPGEAWSDALIDVMPEKGEQRRHWVSLLSHVRDSTPKPSKKWLKQAADMVETIGGDLFLDAMFRVLSAVGKPGDVPQRIDPYSEHDLHPTAVSQHGDALLPGLVWAVATLQHHAGDGLIADLAEVCFRRIPRGPSRSTRIGKACIKALAEAGRRDAMMQLLRLELKLRVPEARKTIEKELPKAAAKLGVAIEELAESAVPDYGLKDGVCEKKVGDAVATIRVSPAGKPSMEWVTGSGERRKAVPAALNKSHGEEVATVKQTAKDIESMVTAQRYRLNRLMRADKQWAVGPWRANYEEHPLVGLLARRLIWCFDDRAAVDHDGEWVDAGARPVAIDEHARVSLWHPLGKPSQDVLAWRERLAALQISQPIKQAHREIYELTDAERSTRIYSNRFAGHILRNGLMITLCQNLHWKTGLFGGETGPKLRLPHFNLLATYRVDTAGDELHDFGIPPYVATDQLRFFPLDGPNYDEPLALEDIPALALSEVMRDIDTIVSIASVGNDPNWQDGGPEGRYRDYWHDYAFGDLGATSKTRKDILQRLIPRLKIAERCSFDDKFLVVRGDKRTYKIHLGSSNILMQPNDQYLCIVPGRGDAKIGDKVFLPFEGDQRLAVILSKAMMLAEDTKIKDPTILSQIGH